jgi:hypothetical protein
MFSDSDPEDIKLTKNAHFLVLSYITEVNLQPIASLFKIKDKIFKKRKKNNATFFSALKNPGIWISNEVKCWIATRNKN